MSALCRATLCAAVLVTAGCYHYQPVGEAPPPPGAKVRAHVDLREAEALREAVGREERFVDGTVLEAAADRLLLQVRVGTAGSRVFQELTVPRSSIERLEVRTLDKRGTLLLVGGIVGAGVAAGIAISASGDDQVTIPDDDIEAGVVPVSVPLVRVPLSWPLRLTLGGG
ncbi:MAG: hypothetical protein D6701_00675 [Gemmatimonadetes bacterium]|nr:MAG: hypothetical protein D6701_00675 [Gemmatimonadota bacterium]